jgi:hypothetical protein
MKEPTMTTEKPTPAFAESVLAVASSLEALARQLRADHAAAVAAPPPASEDLATYLIVANGEVDRARGFERAMAVTRSMADKGHTVTVSRVSEEALRALKESVGAVRVSRPVAAATPADMAAVMRVTPPAKPDGGDDP